jgi:L-ribulose-5-phosphate 4-epimerase
MLENLKNEICLANLQLKSSGLVIQTWGNVSGIDRQAGLVVIKPSGLGYDQMTPDAMVAVSLETGEVAEGDLCPSSDLPTHLELYRAFEQIGGIAHTHSTTATMFAQACTAIPCFGTTHADYFNGPVPVTRPLNQGETQNQYETNTGKVIVECMTDLDLTEMPAVLVANHGPFTWGQTPGTAVESGIVLEEVAKIAMGTMQINPSTKPIEDHLLKKHYSRKHGVGAYYGQKE